MQTTTDNPSHTILVVEEDDVTRTFLATSSPPTATPSTTRPSAGPVRHAASRRGAHRRQRRQRPSLRGAGPHWTTDHQITTA